MRFKLQIHYRVLTAKVLFENKNSNHLDCYCWFLNLLEVVAYTQYQTT